MTESQVEGSFELIMNQKLQFLEELNEMDLQRGMLESSLFRCYIAIAEVCALGGSTSKA